MTRAKRYAPSATARRRNCTSMSLSGPCPTMEGLVGASESILQAVRELSQKSGHTFEISPDTVPGTQMFVVHTSNHSFRLEYTAESGTFGFRVPANLPDA